MYKGRSTESKMKPMSS